MTQATNEYNLLPIKWRERLLSLLQALRASAPVANLKIQMYSKRTYCNPLDKLLDQETNLKYFWWKVHDEQNVQGSYHLCNKLEIIWCIQQIEATQEKSLQEKNLFQGARKKHFPCRITSMEFKHINDSSDQFYNLTLETLSHQCPQRSYSSKMSWISRLWIFSPSNPYFILVGSMVLSKLSTFCTQHGPYWWLSPGRHPSSSLCGSCRFL